MNKRIGAVQNKLKQLEIDSFLVVSAENRRYLTGFTGTSGWVLITQKDAFFFTDFRYTEQAKEEVKDCHLIKLDQFSPYLSLMKTMQELDLYTIGIESERLTVFHHQELVNQFGRKAICSIDNLVEDIRRIKDQNEIDCIRKAQEIADGAFSHILKVIKPGVSELEIALELEYIMKKNGASALSFDTIVASGLRSAMPHGVASDKKIEYGDLITMDYGCIYQGYCSDMTRTIAVGKADDKQTEIYNLVLKAQESALAQIKAGVIGKDIDAVARQVFKEAGYLQYFGHGLGHSLGLEIHEEPRFSTKDENIMEENMVMTVEPGLYIPKWGGVRIEDLIVITKDGYTNLTNSPKDLIIL